MGVKQRHRWGCREDRPLQPDDARHTRVEFNDAPIDVVGPADLEHPDVVGRDRGQRVRAPCQHHRVYAGVGTGAGGSEDTDGRHRAVCASRGGVGRSGDGIGRFARNRIASGGEQRDRHGAEPCAILLVGDTAPKRVDLQRHRARGARPRRQATSRACGGDGQKISQCDDGGRRLGRVDPALLKRGKQRERRLVTPPHGAPAGGIAKGGARPHGRSARTFGTKDTAWTCAASWCDIQPSMSSRS